MSAKQTVLQGSVLRETVGLNLSINRAPQATEPPTVAYSINFSYCDHLYLVDPRGEKVKLLQSYENQKGVAFTPEQAMAFFCTPMKTAEGVDTILGEFISDMWDAQIRVALDTPNP